MTHATRTPAFRIVALALAVSLAAAIPPASAMDRDPLSPVPSWISQGSFDSMDANAIYAIDHAQKLGKRIIIEGHTPSQSRALVDKALTTEIVASRASAFEQRPSERLNRHPESHDR
ncbi:hypothetical protein D6850_09255 [Roseovarius spongiae]|uniref:OmpA-like domain-containing protein n=1 Tax=Roseovarius spongiae TaxID=2320272 RepID=A0A3A8B9S5_9RHOB|nr:hypothetical protein [Roseovarius spongiae]RKF15033.1 hypothetical protein D6850_09255 [Roseovarius spongiae]